MPGNVVVYPLDPTTGDIIGPGVSTNAGIAQTFSLALNAAESRLYAIDGNSGLLATLILDADGDVIGMAPGSPVFVGGIGGSQLAVR